MSILTEDETTSYYLANQVGSVEESFSGGGWPVAQDTIYPYGMEPSPSVAPNRYRFAGMERDGTSSLDHTPYRQYAAAMGRWMTPDPWNGSYDPANPQSFNRYLYVNGNPLTFNDPSGLDFNYSCGNGCVGVVGDIPGIDPISSMINLGLFAYDFLSAVLGLGGPPQFNGNVNASQSGKNVPTTPNTPSGGKRRIVCFQIR